MRTTLIIDDELLKEARALSGVKTKRDVVEKALEEFVKRRKARKLLDLEGKIDMVMTVEDLARLRKRDVPDR